jgi:gas vesicle protein
VLAGAALGAVVMALATPRTGREVRSTLRRALGARQPDPADGTGWDPEDLEAMFI